jgi:DNA mismatch repair protein MLH1
MIKQILTASDAKKKILSQHKVRTSLQDRTLDSMFPVVNPAQIGGNSGINGKTDDSSPGILKPFDVRESECFLSSVRTLRQNLVKGKHRRKRLFALASLFTGD